MSHNIIIESGKSVRLTTAGKYCDRDIIVSANGEDLDEVLSQQDTLLKELVDTLDEKAAESPVEYEVWTITYADGTTEKKKVAFV